MKEKRRKKTIHHINAFVHAYIFHSIPVTVQTAMRMGCLQMAQLIEIGDGFFFFFLCVCSRERHKEAMWVFTQRKRFMHLGNVDWNGPDVLWIQITIL